MVLEAGNVVERGFGAQADGRGVVVERVGIGEFDTSRVGIDGRDGVTYHPRTVDDVPERDLDGVTVLRPPDDPV